MFEFVELMKGTALFICRLWRINFACLLAAPLASASDVLNVEFEADDRVALSIPKADLLKLEAVVEKPIYITYAKQDVTGLVLPLVDFLSFINADPSSAVLAKSYDGYFSVFQPEFIKKYEPYILLAFKDLPPDELKIEGSPDLGPYYLTFAARPEKGSSELFDPDNKRPYGVNWIKVGSYEKMMQPLYAGSLETLDPQAQLGRQLYINNCMSCHVYNGSDLGGDFSNRTTNILAVHAKFNVDYFRRMVMDPSKLMPDVLMPSHPHYTDEDILAIVEFLRASSDNEN